MAVLTVAGQLEGDLLARWARWARWCPGPVHREVAGAIRASVPRVVRDLVRGDARAAYDVVWFLGGPAGVPADWWRSPLGLACARAYDPGVGCVSQSEASRILGITRARVGQLVGSGKLECDPAGGVLLASVLRRLAALAV